MEEEEEEGKKPHSLPGFSVYQQEGGGGMEATEVEEDKL